MRIIINNFLVQMGYRYVAQVDLEVLGSNGPSASASPHHVSPHPGLQEKLLHKAVCYENKPLFGQHRKCKQKRVAQHKTYSRHSFTSDMTYFHPLQKKKKKKACIFLFIYLFSFLFF